MLLANKAPPLPPRKESLGRSGITNHKKDESNSWPITTKKTKKSLPKTDSYTNKESGRRTVCSKKSHVGVICAQKITKPLAVVSSTKTIAGIRTTVCHGHHHQSQKRRVSALKLTRAQSTSSGTPCHSQSHPLPVESSAPCQRPVSPACNPVPEIHKASLSIQIIAPPSDSKTGPESQQHPHGLSPDTSKTPPNNMQQIPTTAPPTHPTECNVVY